MDRDSYVAVNRTGTELLLSTARSCGVNLFVFTSSPSVVFAGTDQRGIDESTPYDFGWMEKYRAFYSYSKAQAEQVVLAANSNDFRTTALRPHLIWGPRDSHLVPRLLQRARSGRLRRVGDGSNLVDITYVENAAAAHVQAADALAAHAALPAGKAYFISQGEPVSCWRWIDEILALVDLPPVTKHLSFRSASRIGGALEFAYRALHLKGEPPMTRFLASQLSTSHWFDISAARRDFGYEPKTSTADGMRHLADWLRTYLSARHT
jgi:nucleoside-diphosphate-sugar epimerase